MRQALPGFEVFGSFCMNFTYGDKINVYAAKMAAATTGKLCRCIWMPTQAAVYQFAKFGQPGMGIPVTGRNGKLLPEVVQVMEICAENGMIFATGHSAPEESILMAQKAHEMGFKKLVITHPNTTIWQMTQTRLNAALITARTLNTATLQAVGQRQRHAGISAPDRRRIFKLC